VHGAHPRRSTRSDRPEPRPAGLPVQRSRRDAHPSAVGWWQPPKPARNKSPKNKAQKNRAQKNARGRAPTGSAAEDTARHRAAQVTDALPVTSAPARAGRGTRRRPGQLPAAQRRARRRRLLRRGLLGAASATVLSPLLAFAVGYLTFSVPNPDEAVNNQVALMSFADGSPLTRLVPEEGNRVKVAITEVPLHVRHAVLAAEDRSFFSNPGFDLTGVLRAAWNQLRGGEGGGSTITQQFVKQALVGDEQTAWRKYKEVVLAVKISQERSKDEILADYLNTIYFGRGAYGIQSAAQAYFGKNVQDLTTSEGALLAGLIQSPSRWDPAVSAERAVERWNFVLDGMVAQGWLMPQARTAAHFPQADALRTLPHGVPTDSRGHIVSAVISELEELGFTQQDVAQEGLRIATTVDPHRQRQVVEAAHDALDRQPANLRSAAVAIDPLTGGVLAYYGGDNGLGLDYARVRKLAGSTFKPFVVLAGLLREPPVGLGEVFDGREVPGLRNAAGADCDECDLKQAMTVSNNVVFHTLTKQLGPEAVVAAARAAGITAPLENPTEGIALGNKEVSTLELASAYATIAAGGVWRQPHLVASVVTADDKVLYEAATEGERRFPERVARNVVEAMIGVPEHDGLALPDERPVAAKTGTVQSRFEGENNDAWMAGFTPSLATAVWMGTDRNSPIRTARGTPIRGSNLPADMWQDFMSDALEGAPVEDFPPFRPIGEPPSPLGPTEETPPPTSGPPATPVPTPPPSGGPTPDEPDSSADLDDLDLPDDPEPEEPEDEDCSVPPCG
jgi:membrane peptidoglycan carboxypeptidase